MGLTKKLFYVKRLVDDDKLVIFCYLKLDVT